MKSAVWSEPANTDCMLSKMCDLINAKYKIMYFKALMIIKKVSVTVKPHALAIIGPSW